MSLNSKSKTFIQQTPVHLQKIYDAREQRTFNLVKQSVDELLKEKQKVSLSTIATKSVILDVEGKGVSISAIQRNEQANTYYKQHRTCQKPTTKRSSVVTKKLNVEEPPHIKHDRDLARTRGRYLKMSKEDLVDRLLVVEQAHTEQVQRWHQTNDDLLTLQLMVEEKSPNRKIDVQMEGDSSSNNLSTQFKARNQELKAKLMGMESLEAEIEELKKQNQYLFNKVIQLEATGRSKAKKDFASAKLQSSFQPDIPDIEF